MARTIAEIQQSMIDAVQADSVLAPVSTSTSKTAIWRLWTRIVAVSIWTLEVLFDTLKVEVTDLLSALKPHGLRWYAAKCKEFQYGFSLPTDTDEYNNTGVSDDVLEASKIVKYAAVTEGDDGKLRIKVASENTTDLIPLTTAQKNAFTEFIARVKDAGVKITIDSLPADKIKLNLKVYYDPLILNEVGSRIDGSNSIPVQSAVKAFLKNQPFNGTFVLAYLVDAIQKVEGVVIPHIVTCETQFGAFPFTTVDVKYLPDAGYLRFNNDSDLVITWIPQGQLL